MSKTTAFILGGGVMGFVLFLCEVHFTDLKFWAIFLVALGWAGAMKDWKSKP